MTAEPRTCRRFAQLVDALIDGDLDEARARAVHAHARACLACARRLEATRTVVETAGSLEPLDPPVALWDRIDARIAADATALAERPGWWWWWQAWHRQILQLGVGAVAAALALLVGLRLVDRSWAPSPHGLADEAKLLPRGSVGTPAPAGAHDGGSDIAPGVAVSPGAGGQAEAGPPDLYLDAVAEIERSDQQYRKAIEELRSIVSSEKGRWQAEVAREFEVNLAAIDAAVVRQRELARREPGNPVAQDALYASYRKEIDFLQEAVMRGQGGL